MTGMKNQLLGQGYRLSRKEVLGLAMLAKSRTLLTSDGGYGFQGGIEVATEGIESLVARQLVVADPHPRLGEFFSEFVSVSEHPEERYEIRLTSPEFNTQVTHFVGLRDARAVIITPEKILGDIESLCALVSEAEGREFLKTMMKKLSWADDSFVEGPFDMSADEYAIFVSCTASQESRPLRERLPLANVPDEFARDCATGLSAGDFMRTLQAGTSSRLTRLRWITTKNHSAWVFDFFPESNSYRFTPVTGGQLSNMLSELVAG